MGQEKKDANYTNRTAPPSRDMDSFLSNNAYRFVEAGYAEVDTTWHKFVAYFPYYRMYFISGGEALLRLKDRDLVLKEGNMYLVPPFQVVTSECPDILKHFYLHFSPNGKVHNYLELYKPVYEVPADGVCPALFRELLDVFAKTDLSSFMKRNGIFQYLLSKFYSDAERVDNEMMRFVPVLKYIDDNISRHLTAAELASVTNLSEVYFSNLFAKTFGISPIKYINNKKLNSAALMLAENKMSVKEIAYHLGFENEVYFFRLFKKTFGLTPKEYRKRSGESMK